MERMRKPFQGVWNIIRFNWHFYGLAAGAVAGLLYGAYLVDEPYGLYLRLLAAGVGVSTLLSLLTSFYIYDLSGLYTLSWLDFVPTDQPMELVTINAGFDETSELLQRKFPSAHLRVFDFYNPMRHTEVSIKRARRAYPAWPGTQTINTSIVPVADQTVDYVFLILAAHEIRQEAERVVFFRELRRILKPAGTIVLVEHQRDTANFLAYTIGFLHFLSPSTWATTFTQAGLRVQNRRKLTPFITLFTLQNDGLAA